jgi:hypothetical protein
VRERQAMTGSETRDVLKQVGVTYCGIYLTELRKTINKLIETKKNLFLSHEIIEFNLSWWFIADIYPDLGYLHCVKAIHTPNMKRKDTEYNQSLTLL